jgi:hypothetical protein
VRVAGAATLALAIAGAATTAHAASDTVGKTTVEQRIAGKGGSGFQFLRLTGGESYTVRKELGTAHGGRDERRRSLAYFAQLTDFQLADEESPARVEFLEPFATPPIPGLVSAAWRPQEALMPHMVDMGIRQVNAFADASPVSQGNGRRARMGFALTTGDSADNVQRNEVQWVVRLLEGGTLTPNSGSSNPADYAACPPGTPGPSEAAKYTGVQDYDDYAESAQFYDPEKPIGLWAVFPKYPGLMDRAEAPFGVEGLKVPSYVAFGNHDGLAQGNQATNRSFEDVATGCVKPLAPDVEPTHALDALDPAFLSGLLTSDPSKTMLVPPDPQRQYVSKAQYEQLHFTGKQADAHGFGLVDPAEKAASGGAAGYYAWSPAPRFRFVAIDTLCEGGVAGPGAEGNIDDPQFQWLERQLKAGTKADELIVLFGHHPIRSLECPDPDEAAPPCTSNDQHGHDRNPGCDVDPRESTPLHLGPGSISGEGVKFGEHLRDLLLRYPHVIAYVAGHTHENKITAFKRSGGKTGFWGIETAAEADWPHQNRLVEVMDNRDGTLSIFGTVLDNAAPTAAPASGTSASGLGAEPLASIGRALGFNDPQAGSGSGEGVRADRNVELLIGDPRESAGGGAGSAKNRLRLSMRPRRVRAGRRIRYSFRVTSRAKAIKGALVRFAGKRSRTNRRGRATIVKRIRRTGLFRARASRRGYRSVRRPVRVLRRARPRFTG